MRANTRFPNRPELVQAHNPDTTLRVYEHAEANKAYARKEINGFNEYLQKMIIFFS